MPKNNWKKFDCPQATWDEIERLLHKVKEARTILSSMRQQNRQTDKKLKEILEEFNAIILKPIKK